MAASSCARVFGIGQRRHPGGRDVSDDVNPADRAHPETGAPGSIPPPSPESDRGSTTARLRMWRDELFAWCRMLASAGVYATLIVTFVVQVARVEGTSMAPTLADQDRLVVNKLVYL